MADFSIDGYCVWAERMEAAGAIIIGRGNSPTSWSGALSCTPRTTMSPRPLISKPGLSPGLEKAAAGNAAPAAA